jgi:RNA polymerase sigma-70 factor (ECF subfamily)
VTSALKRARATLREQLREEAEQQPPPAPGSPAEQQLVRRFAEAFGAHDIDGIVALLTEDAWVRMPPMPFEYAGREAAARFFAALPVRPGEFRFIPARANRQPAFAVYRQDRLLVLTLRGELISEITRFEAGVLAGFGMPRTLA